MSDCGSTAANWTGQTVTATSGNSCIACPDGYTCEGGNVCPVRNGINCAAGTYIKANTTTCTPCLAGNYCPGITTDSVTSTSSDRGITQCPEGSYCPAGSSSPKSCPTNYGNSAAGSDAQSDCYTRCGVGAVVTVPNTACTTPAGAWYSTEAHVVYYGSISPVAYCPYGSDSRNGVTSLHDQGADCVVTVPAGYSSAVPNSSARYIRISSETGAFPLAEIQAYTSSTQLSLVLGSGMSSGANALDGSLTTQGTVTTGSAVGVYAIFDLGGTLPITNIKFALGNVTGGYNIVIAISSDRSNWTTVFNQTVYGVLRLPGVLQDVPLNTRTNTKCSAGTYHGATTLPATAGVNCTSCPTAICNGETNCASGFTTHRNTYPANYHSGDNLKLVKTWFATASNTGNTSIEECKLSYTYTNNRGTFNHDEVRYQSSTGRYDGVGGVVYYTVLNPGYYGSGKIPDGYCDIDTNIRRHYYQDAVVCPAGKYCSGYTQMPLCSSGTYNDTMGIDGLLSGGYFSTGGAKKATPTSADCVGVVGADIWSSSVSPVKNVCGQLLPGYYSKEGAILPAPGELGAKNTAALGFNIDYLNQGLDSVRAGCLGESGQCGMVSAGWFSSGAATSSTPSSSDCVSGTCGICPAGSYSAAGATTCTACPALTSGWEYVPLEGGTSYTSCRQYTTPDGCAAGKIALTAASATAWQPLAAVKVYSWATSSSVLTAKPGYYRTSSTALSCTICPAGTFSTGGEVSSCANISAGYFSSGAATSPTPSSADCVSGTCGICEKGTYSAAGATSCSSCPALGGSNWSWDMSQGAKKYSECKRKGVPDGCRAGTVTDTASSATTWGNRVLTEWAAPGNTQMLAKAGYQIDVTNLKCTICPNGHYSTGATGICQPVAAGYYATGAAETEKPSSSDCVSGTCGKVQATCYGASGATSACPNKCKDVANGTYPQSDEGADSVNKCFTSGSAMGGGYIATAGGLRLDCPLGTYNAFHAVYYGQTSRCTVCPSGTTTTTQGAHNTSSASCDVLCTNGDGVHEWQVPELSSDGGTVLKLCQAASCKMGHALDGNQCNECPQGQYQSVDGYSESMCSITPAGYYNNKTGATEPVPCPAGQWSSMQSTSCSILPAGYWNTGCGTDESGAVCTEDYDGGKIDAGYWGEEGATTSKGSGRVDAGYYSTGGGTAARPTSTGNGCLKGNGCGQLLPGYWNDGCGINPKGGIDSSCSSSNSGGIIDAGYWGGYGATSSKGSGKVSAGYWNNGCGTNPEGGIQSSCSQNQGGTIAAGHWGEAGATTGSGSGTVFPGYFSTGGATAQKPSNTDCVGDNECGLVDAGYWTSWGGRTNTPANAETDCVNKACGVLEAGYYSTGGATRQNPTEIGNHCFGTECGRVEAGYYSNGGGTSAKGTCLNGNKCGVLNSGVYSTCGAKNIGDSSTDGFIQCLSGCECGLVGAGFYSTGGGTSANGTCLEGYECGPMAAGYYSRGGAGNSTASGFYCWGYNSYSDGRNGCGQVSAGYWNNGGGTDYNGTCIDGKQCGEIEAGYWGAAGATSSTGSGQVDGGYFATGGATVAKPTASDCVGSGNTCGLINAGYWSVSGAKTATPTAKSDCIGMGDDYDYCGVISSGYYSTCGATYKYPATQDVDCVAGCVCGAIQSGYYNDGCGIDDIGGVCSGNYKGGVVPAGYYTTDGSSMSPVAAGYYSTGGGTSPNGTCISGYECGAIAGGFYATGGGTTANGTCIDGKSCGLIEAGYYSTGGAKKAAPYLSNSCVGKKSDGTANTCGIVDGGYYSTGGATTKTPTANGNGCTGSGKTCGKLAVAYYSNGGGTSATGTCIEGQTCGICDSNYRGGTLTGKTSESQCQASCAVGTRVVSANAACTSPAGGWFTGAHLVNWGNISPVNYCMDGYTSTSTSASGHDAKSDCVQTVQGKSVDATTIAARYIKVTSSGSAKNSDTHMLEIQAFASADGTGTNLLSGKGGTTGSKLTAATDGSWTRGTTVETYAQGSTLVWDLGSVQNLGSIKFAMYTDGRVYQNMAISVSENNQDYTTVFQDADFQTQNTENPTGELVVLSAAPKSCATGTYKASTTVALGNTVACNLADAGYFVGTTGASSQTKCVMGSYTNATGQSACKACAGGKTNSEDGATSCAATCSNATGVASTGWETPVWGTDNKMTNLCTVKATAGCSANYYKNSNACATCASGTNSKYTLSAAGTTTVNDCYLNTTATNYVASAGAGLTSCAAGGYCPGSVKVYYGGTASDTHPTTGGRTQCPANSYCVAGVSAAAKCSEIANTNGFYPNSTAGSDEAADCKTNSISGSYVAKDASSATQCAGGTYKGSHQVNYGSSSSCSDCTAGNYCPKGASSQTSCATVGGKLYVNSATKSDAAEDCYISLAATKYLASATSTSVSSCTAGNYCAGGNFYYSSTAKNQGLTQCPANSYCVAGVSEPVACSTLGGGLYKNSTAGSDAAEDCNFTTTAGKYMVANTDTAQTTCPAKQYCEAETLNWPNASVLNDGGWNACPSASQHKRTSFPVNYYNPTFESTSVTSPTGKGSISGCQALNWLDSATHGGLYEYVNYNPNSGKYDTTSTYRWHSAKPGYYLTDKNGCGGYAYYQTIKECEPGSYCPGKNKVSCNKDNQATVHTHTFGLNSCTSLGAFYTTSPAGAKADTACYGTTTKTKYIAKPKDATESTCAENGYCPGGATVNYDGTGGRTACSGSYTLAASGSDDANDCYLKTTAGQYVQTAGAGQKTCPAGYWCVGNVVIYKGGSVTGRSTTGGSEQCPAGYRDGTTGYSLQSQCTMNVLGGKYVKVEKESSASGICDLGTYKPAHPVTYGKTSSCIPCPNATYADQKGLSACEACPTATKYADKVVSYGSNKTARSTCFAKFEDTVKNGETTYFSCYLRSGDDYGTLTSGNNCWTHGARTKCDAGYYSPVVPSTQYDEMWYMNYSTVVNNLCMPVESGYWSGADSLTRTACATGLVTCGAGLCANEAGDCGRKLHAGDNVIYLRSEKRTTPSLNVKVGDKVFYGNLGDVIANSLRVKNGTMNYSVVNDNQ